MITGQIIQSSIDEMKGITRIDMCVLDMDGRAVASTFPKENIDSSIVQSFAASVADSQVIHGYYFFKVFDEQIPEYILVARGSGDDAYMIGKIAVSQIQSLIVAYKERYDKNNFIQNLLLDNLLLVDVYNRAKKLHIDVDARRAVFIIETENEKDGIALETLKMLFAGKTGDFITAVDERSLILVKELKKEETYETLKEVGKTIRDMLNTEAMTSVRIAYGTIVNEIKFVSQSYKEAKMALDVGKIFYVEKDILSYNMLGIGRLIYQLPLPLCEMFMKETFGDQLLDALDEETITTINKFFENNLNVSETARQLFVHRNTLVYRLEKIQKSTGLDIRVFDDALTFKIAMMVTSYMNYEKA